VVRFGGIIVWAGPESSSALLDFLAQSARNLAAVPDGGRQLADHIAGVLETRDPEPAAAFLTLGPDGSQFVVLLHGPVQLWDGARWWAPSPTPGWLRAVVVAQPAFGVGPAGSPAPPLRSSSVLDLEAGLVPGGGFVFVPVPQINPWAPEPSPAAQVPPPPAPVTPGSATVSGPVVAGEPTVVGPVLVPPDLTVVGPRTAPPAPPPPEASGPAPDRAAPAGTDAPVPAGTSERAAAPPGSVGAGSPPADAHPGPAGAVDLRSVVAPVTTPLAAVGAISAGIPSRPVVRGIRCPNGHFNHPESRACPVCGTSLTEGDRLAVSGSRPALGVLIRDDGAVFRLDTGYVVGWDPTSDPTVNGGLARPLVLTVPDGAAGTGGGPSPSHAEIRLTDWDVGVVDRGSESGTWLLSPGDKDWSRIDAYQTVRLRPGTHMAFGRRILTYMSPWPG
jgi:hypothetical protein